MVSAQGYNEGAYYCTPSTMASAQRHEDNTPNGISEQSPHQPFEMLSQMESGGTHKPSVHNSSDSFVLFPSHEESPQIHRDTSPLITPKLNAQTLFAFGVSKLLFDPSVPGFKLLA